MPKTIKRDCPEFSEYTEFKVGDYVRVWDHPKCSLNLRPDRYVEGFITEITDDELLKIHVIKDTCFALGARLVITTPVNVIFDHPNRIEYLGKFDPETYKFVQVKC